jgi:hypothetical protein
VSGVPISVGLRNFTSLEFAGDAEAATGLIRAMIGQLLNRRGEVAIVTLSARQEQELCQNNEGNLRARHRATPRDARRTGGEPEKIRTLRAQVFRRRIPSGVYQPCSKTFCRGAQLCPAWIQGGIWCGIHP